VEARIRTKPDRTIRRKLVVAAAAVLAATTLMSAPTSAGVWNYSRTVTSGSTTFVNANRSCSHQGGTVSIRQTGSSPYATGRYRLRNVNRRTYTGSRDAQNNGLGVWTNVVSGSFELQVRRAYPQDTNGSFSPGSGNTTFSGRLRCP
jgi:hypothetical protein